MPTRPRRRRRPGPSHGCPSPRWKDTPETTRSAPLSGGSASGGRDGGGGGASAGGAGGGGGASGRRARHGGTHGRHAPGHGGTRRLGRGHRRAGTRRPGRVSPGSCATPPPSAALRRRQRRRRPEGRRQRRPARRRIGESASRFSSHGGGPCASACCGLAVNLPPTSAVKSESRPKTLDVMKCRAAWNHAVRFRVLRAII